MRAQAGPVPPVLPVLRVLPVVPVLAVGLLCIVAMAGCLGAAPPGDGSSSTASSTPAWTPPPGDGLRLAVFANGLQQPLALVPLPDGSGRFLVLERVGLVRLVEADGRVAQKPYFDIRDRVGSSGGEQGLLGLALLPDFAQTGMAVVAYTDLAGDSVLARFSSRDGVLFPPSEEMLLAVDQPFENHNGGHVLFGPDGMLYYGLGDGGLRDDPEGNGQNRLALLGKILRLKVGPSGAYSVPSDNPFVDDPLSRPEVWAYGLRNPWRFSFDRQTGDLWIADVGQDMWEEVDLQPAASRGGENYGWNMYEGNHLYRPGLALDVTQPVAEYTHDDGCSVTGGYVYRGTAIPALAGAYLFGDFCSGTIWRLDRQGSSWDMSVLLETGLSVSSFGEDPAGELYVVDLGGSVHKLVA